MSEDTCPNDTVCTTAVVVMRRPRMNIPLAEGEPRRGALAGVLGHGQDVLQGTEGPAVAQGSQAQTGVRRRPDAARPPSPEYPPSPKGELPKAVATAVRGFNNAAFNAKALAVNVSDLEKKFEYPPRPKVELP